MQVYIHEKFHDKRSHILLKNGLLHQFISNQLTSGILRWEKVISAEFSSTKVPLIKLDRASCGSGAERWSRIMDETPVSRFILYICWDFMPLTKAWQWMQSDGSFPSPDTLTQFTVLPGTAKNRHMGSGPSDPGSVLLDGSMGILQWRPFSHCLLNATYLLYTSLCPCSNIVGR